MGTLEVRVATAQDDPGVQALFHSLGVAIDGPSWGRAFSAGAPKGASSRPYVALRDNRVVAFCAARPRLFVIDGQEVWLQCLHDLAVLPGQEEGLLLEDFLRPIISRAPATIVGGVGPRLAALLARERWQPLGYFRRWGLNTVQWAAAQARKPRGEALTIATDLEVVGTFGREFDGAFDFLLEERRLHHSRSHARLQWQYLDGIPGRYRCLTMRSGGRVAGLVVYLETEGSGRPDWLVVDVAARLGDAPMLLASLRKAAVATKADVYLSMLCEEWTPIIQGVGFEPLRPRWPVFWMLGGEEHRDLAVPLARRGTWFLTPGDLELDRG